MKMEMARVKIRSVDAQVLRRRPIPEGLVGGTITLEFADPVWEGMAKTVVFRGFGTVSVSCTGPVIPIPASVVSCQGLRLEVGVYGISQDESLVIPTIWADLGWVQDAADPEGDPAMDPQLPVWGILQNAVGDLNALETQAKQDLVSAINEVRQSAGGLEEDQVLALIRQELGVIEDGTY